MQINSCIFAFVYKAKETLLKMLINLYFALGT